MIKGYSVAASLVKGGLRNGSGAIIILTVKRIFDFIGAAAILLVAGLPLLLIAVLIYLTMGAPIFFRQTRIGEGEQAFEIVKFRTMCNSKDGTGNLLQDGDRLTGLGRFLRATSLDELPELINILKGEMSFVGPRPLLPAYLPYYLDEHRRRHDMKPGLTGLAQVSGRNAISWDDRLALDVHYVEGWSLWLDVKILWRTVWSVMSRKGISADGHETMPRFDDQVRAGIAKGKTHGEETR